jgi:hypothetical protein
MAYGKVRVDQIQSSTRTVDVDDLATTDVATQSVAGLLSATDKTKLDGVAAGAEVNVNADWNAGSGDAQILNKPTIGTSANNLVQLDGSARLPAVDGSQLTGLVAATDLSYTAATRVIASSTGTDATLTLVTSTDAGLAPASGGGTTNFLRADGTFAAPPGGSPGGTNTQIQFNSSGSFAGDADLTWNSSTNVLGVTGDVNLSDGGTYTTTLQTITPTAARTISLPDATGTVALVAGSSGQLLYNNAGVNAGVGSSAIGTTGDITLSLNGAASTPPLDITGTWFTGGTSTTTKPQVLIEPTGATSTAWSTSGTGLGVNAASGFGGNLLDLQVNGTSRFSVSSAGAVSTASSVSAGIGLFGSSPIAGTALGARSDGGSEQQLFRLTNGNSNSGARASIIFANNAAITSFVRSTASTSTPANALELGTYGAGGDLALITQNTIRLTIGASGGLTVTDANNITVGTTTGTKIGTATTQKLGFYNQAPVVQPAAVADATTSVDVITQFNALLARMRDLGLIAT